MRTIRGILVAVLFAGVVFSAGCVTKLPEVGMTHEVDSSVLKAVKYDDITQDLTLTFTDGDVYVYQAVPESTYKGLMTSRSKGKYYQEKIKDVFEHTKR